MRDIHSPLAARRSSPLPFDKRRTGSASPRQGPSAFAHEFAHLEHAPASRGIPAFFHSPPASECLSLAWPRERHQREGHPTLAPYAQSLCSRYARLLRGSPTVHPWTGVELAHIVWAILRTIPPQSRRE